MKHLYRLFETDRPSESKLVATYTVELKTPEAVNSENTPTRQWLRVNRRGELVR